MSDAPRTGEQPVEPGTKDEDGAPVTQAEVQPDRRPAGVPGDTVTESDGSGMTGGSSGGTGGTSGMPGHPDAAR